MNQLKKTGWKPWIVEKWNHFAGIRQDLYGIIDVVAIRCDVNGVKGIQCTSMGNGSARVKKALQNEYLSDWCDAGNSFEIWEWGKRGKRGERKKWTLRITTVSPLMDPEKIGGTI